MSKELLELKLKTADLEIKELKEEVKNLNKHKDNLKDYNEELLRVADEYKDKIWSLELKIRNLKGVKKSND